MCGLAYPRCVEMQKRAPRALVIVPTYNERENLASLAAEILAQGEAFHLLVVDDSSPDGTGEIADRLAAVEPRVTVLHRARKSGRKTNSHR